MDSAWNQNILHHVPELIADAYVQFKVSASSCFIYSWLLIFELCLLMSNGFHCALLQIDTSINVTRTFPEFERLNSETRHLTSHFLFFYLRR